ncbi:MAG TPA: glycosyltransferase family 2 protein [Rubricoccaceae bacterium]|nr:glycosyltransferase family 2 protein [Rubricoccaceae bacterium]
MPPRSPLVSVGLPVYNGARYLPETLADVLGQTFEDFELVICDNASTDETEALCREAAARDPRVRYVRNGRNLGALPNTNLTFAHSRGRLFCLAGHDDRRTPDFLATLVAALEEEPGAVLAYGRCGLIGAQGEPFRFDAAAQRWRDSEGRTLPYDRALERSMPDEPVARFRAVLRSRDVNSPVHGLFRREVLEKHGPQTLYGSDRLLVAHAALLGRFAFVDRELFRYRIHPESTLFLDRTTWARRETGRDGAASFTAPLRTFANYLRTAATVDLPPVRRAAACLTATGYALRTDALQRALLPGPDNYFGLRRWPWQEAADGGQWAMDGG